MERKNINRGFKQLQVWNNSIELYILTCKLLSGFPYELKETVIYCNDSSFTINPKMINPAFQHSNIPIFQHSDVPR